MSGRGGFLNFVHLIYLGRGAVFDINAVLYEALMPGALFVANCMCIFILLSEHI